MKKINVLHVITDLEPGGAENLLLDVCRKLDKERFKVRVAYIYGPGTLADQLRRTGVPVVDLSRRGKIDLLLPFKLVLLMRKERIRIVHTHLVHASIAGRIGGKLARIESIITTRHYGYYHKRESFINWMERKSARFNTRFVAISKAVKEYMVKKEKYEPETITVVYNAVDPALFDPGDSKTWPQRNEGLIVGTAGRLHPSKGYATLLESMRKVTERFPQTRLMIAGNGAERDRLEELCSRLSISDKVVFLGKKTPAEIAHFLKEINLFVLASNWEGFGLALIEAMSTGKAVVATKVGGIPEVVENEQTGFLVPPGQPEALAEKIIYLLGNPNLSEQMGRRGRKRVETLFSLDSMIAKLEELYNKLLNQETVPATIRSDPQPWKIDKR